MYIGQSHLFYLLCSIGLTEQHAAERTEFTSTRMRRRARVRHAPPPVASFERLVHEAAR